MERHEVVGAGLLAAGLGHVYYSPFVLAFSSVGMVLTLVMAAGILQTAAGFFAGDAWGAGVGAGTAAVAGLWNFQGLLFGSVTVWSVGEFLEGLGVLLLALAIAAWSWARSPRRDDAAGIDEERAVVGFQVACGISAASSLLFGIADVVYWNPLLLPGNALVVAGFGVPAFLAREPLFGEVERQEVEEREAGEREAVEGGQAS